MSKLSNAIDEKVGEIRTDAIDLSFGEIVNIRGCLGGQMSRNLAL